MKSKYSNGNIFTDVKIEKFPRHKFNKGYFNFFTCNHGLAVPFFVDDVIPGDKVDLKTIGRVQLQPLATATMQNIRCYFRYFYVPYRLIWENWDKFMTQDPSSEVALTAPYTRLDFRLINLIADNSGCLSDMLGVGVNPRISDEPAYVDTNTKLDVNLFRWAAYHLIWNEYFRDENLQSEVFIGPTRDSLDDGFNSTNDTLLNSLLPVAYSKDYFTSALPWPQKGEPVNLNAYVVSNNLSGYTLPSAVIARDSDGHLTETFYSGESLVNRPYNELALSSLTIRPNTILSLESQQTSVSVDVPANTLATSININDLRYANALQRFLERRALGGSRPAEYYLSMYGVKVDDLRIGRPEYLGGGYSNITVSDIASSVETYNDDGTIRNPQGTLAGNGKSFPAMSINKPYYCQEFGIVMGIMYLRPELNYLQGVHRSLRNLKTLDFYNPIFAHLGEEAVLKSELVISDGLVSTNDENNNDSIFGYQSRYAYLKHKRNEVHGDFRSSMRSWLLSPLLPDNVELNPDFISVQQDYSIFAVVDRNVHHYLCEFYNDYQVESSMPNFAIPSL